jgi:hypothetical protein
MGRRIALSDAQMSWLRTHYSDGKGPPIKRVARLLGVCPDTLKRILMREGLAEFEGAKYALPLSYYRHNAATWERPCLRCKTTAPRPKWQYVCDSCKAAADDGLPDNWH